MIRSVYSFLAFLAFAFLAGCSSNETIVNQVGEREANEIVVFLASKGIEAQKVQAASGTVGATAPSNQYNISVASDRATEAMSFLNRYGLPRQKGTTLLELFAPQGLMSSNKEETIRYQAGLAEELRTTIRKMDGVIDADVQISFPDTNAAVPGTTLPKPTAAVFVKHQGVLEDPNSHLETKIKRLLAGSITDLETQNVSVIADRSRFADIQLDPSGELMTTKPLQQTYVSLWGLVMTQSSLGRFRLLFFTLILLVLLLGGLAGWLIYRFYPEWKRTREEKDSSSASSP